MESDDILDQSQENQVDSIDIRDLLDVANAKVFDDDHDLISKTKNFEKVASFENSHGILRAYRLLCQFYTIYFVLMMSVSVISVLQYRQLQYTIVLSILKDTSNIRVSFHFLICLVINRHPKTACSPSDE